MGAFLKEVDKLPREEARLESLKNAIKVTNGELQSTNNFKFVFNDDRVIISSISKVNYYSTLQSSV